MYDKGTCLDQCQTVYERPYQISSNRICNRTVAVMS
jgi:hypothetical protein